jgi:hypothetical protein
LTCRLLLVLPRMLLLMARLLLRDDSVMLWSLLPQKSCLIGTNSTFMLSCLQVLLLELL